MGREIDGRPLVLLALALVLGLVAPTQPLVLLFLAVGLGWFRTVRVWAILAVGFGFGLVLSPTVPAPVLSPVFEQGSLRIASIPHEALGRSAANGEICGLRVRVSCPESMDVHFGDLWSVSGVVKPIGEMSAAALASDGVQGRLTLSGGTRVSSGPWIFGAADGVRRRFEAFAGSAVGQDDAEWLDQLSFRSGSLAPQDREELQEAGTSYLVAASGLQVGVLAALVMVAFGCLRVDRRVAVGATIVVLLVYCLSTGGHLSTWRASLACGLFLSAYLWRRDPDTLSALALADIGFLLVDPRAVYSLAFSVTNVVIVGLALFMPRGAIREGFKDRVLGWLRQAVLAGLIVVLAGQPLFAHGLGRVSLGTMPAVFLTGLVVPAVLGLSVVGFGVGLAWPALGAGCLGLARPLIGYLRLVTHALASAGFGFDVPAFSGWWLVAYYGLWLMVWRPRVRQS